MTAIPRFIALLMLFVLSQSTADAQLNNELLVPKDTIVVYEISSLYGEGGRIKITADGGVTFESSTFLFDILAIRARISQEELKDLVGEFERINYFSLSDEYNMDNGCPRAHYDSSSIRTSLTINGKSKSIDHYQACFDKDGRRFPAELNALERRIETLVNLKWRYR